MFLLWATSALAGDLSLNDALEQALRANYELRQDRLDLRQAELAVTEAQGSFDPSLWASTSAAGSRSLSNSITENTGQEPDVVESTALGLSTGVSQELPTGGSVNMGWYRSRSATDSPGQLLSTSYQEQLALSLSQPLLNGAGPQATRYTLRDAERDLDSEALAYRAAMEQLVLDVSDAYWSLVAAGESLVLARRSLEIAERQLDDTRERLEEGFAALGDVLQVERAVGVARQAVVVAEADLENGEGELSRLLGVPARQQHDLQPQDRPIIPELDLDVQRSLALARENNAAWLQQRIAVESAEDSLLLARNQALPSLGLSASLGFTGLANAPPAARTLMLSGELPTWSAGMSFSVPIPGRATHAERDSSYLELVKTRLERASAEQDLVLAVESAVRGVRRDHSRVALARRTVQAARAALDADQELLQDGRGSTRDVVLSLEALDEAQVSQLEAEIDLQSSLLELLRSEGVLLETLGLALPAPQP